MDTMTDPHDLIAQVRREEWRDEPIRHEALPKRIARAFAMQGVETWGQVADVPDAGWLRYQAFGKDSLRRVHREVRERRQRPPALPLPSSIDLSPRKPAPLPPTPGVYFIRLGQFVKIGRAIDISKRFRGLQTNLPYALELVGFVRVGVDALVVTERAYHARFSKHRVSGEWFYERDDLAQFCRELVCPTKPT